MCLLAPLACHPGLRPTGTILPKAASYTPTTEPGPRQLLASAQQGDALWPERGDSNQLVACIAAWEQAWRGQEATSLAEAAPKGDATAVQTRYRLASKLARAYFLLGYAHLHPKHEVVATKQAFAGGVQCAEAALREVSPSFRAALATGDGLEEAIATIDGAGLDALTWYVGNLGGFAAAKGATAALFYAERLRVGISRLLFLDPTYAHGTPHRFMGAFLAKMPAFAGGNLRAAHDHFLQALTVAPLYFDNALTFARLYAKPKRDWALYRQLVGQVLAGDPAALPEVQPELQLQQAEAVLLSQQKGYAP